MHSLNHIISQKLQNVTQWYTEMRIENSMIMNEELRINSRLKQGNS